MKHPISKESYEKLLKSINNADIHTAKIIKKYKRIISEAKKANDIESAYLANEIMTIIFMGAPSKHFDSANNRLNKSIARCKANGGYTLEVYDGVKYALTKDEEYWILHNKLNGEKFFSRYYSDYYEEC